MKLSRVCVFTLFIWKRCGFIEGLSPIVVTNGLAQLITASHYLGC